MEFNQESNDQQVDEEVSTEQSQFKQWLQDNMRIIVSILIVVIIAGGVYSYSKRTEAPTVSEEEILATTENENVTPSQGSVSESTSTQKEGTVKEEKNSSVAISQETENSFIETASRGDGRTTLARKALANYLEKNPDSALTAEHKIYIEDFLRKNVKHDGGISIGTSVEFSKGLIENAIAKSKTLNDNQLQNLHKYAVRVPSLS